MAHVSHIIESATNGKREGGAVLKCACKEKLMFPEGEEIILKCRIVKIVDGMAWAKCKRCCQWVLIPLRLSG